MSYSIKPDSNYKDLDLDQVSTEEFIRNSNKIKFPAGLNLFFERSGAFGETCEFYQIQKILNIDLSIFDFTSFPEDEETHEPEDNWIMIDSMMEKLNELTDSIKRNPEYFTLVKFENGFNNQQEYESISKSHHDELLKLVIQANLKGASEKERRESLEKFDFGKFGILYPIKNDYLSSGEFDRDLEELKEILSFLKSEHVIKINFRYT